MLVLGHLIDVANEADRLRQVRCDQDFTAAVLQLLVLEVPEVGFEDAQHIRDQIAVLFLLGEDQLAVLRFVCFDHFLGRLTGGSSVQKVVDEDALQQGCWLGLLLESLNVFILEGLMAATPEFDLRVAYVGHEIYPIQLQAEVHRLFQRPTDPARGQPRSAPGAYRDRTP